ncbi:hypothetical protein BC833DRAFT_55292 [Globomyces pollinis-pini]|nr:hypothetical protein BC833DRAFT_55292 [Globomyces pollinis-pini]
MLNKENTIDTLAKITNVSVYKLLYRSMKIIKELNMMRLEFPNTDDQTRLLRYRAILKDYLEKNPDKLNIPQQVPYPSTNLRFEWTDQDKFKLKSLARKLEYAWPLLVYDFPTSAQEIQTEYNRLFDRVVFTPADDQQILDWMSKKYSSASRYNTLHHQCFPNRSIGSLKYRHRYLRKNRTILTPEEVKRISNGIQRTLTIY